MKQTLPTQYIFDIPITSLYFEQQILLMLHWARANESKVVCLANVHMLMEAYWNQDFAHVLRNADLVAPDGMPLVWMLRLMGISNQNRVAGMDVFINLCQLASICNVSVYFLGSQPKILDLMKNKLELEFPALSIAGMESLPFRPLTTEENEALIKKVNYSGAGLIFVCLGCPKQENWISQNRGKINGVMIGVGAVFAVYVGCQKRAPLFIRELGLEWFYRLIQEPRRLWRRYGTTIPPFIYLAIKQLINHSKLKLRKIKQNLADENLTFDVNNLDMKSYSKIGEILIYNKLLTRSALEKALLEQKICPELKIGEILVNQKLMSPKLVNLYLELQNIKLGQIALKKKIISEAKLKKILDYQINNGGKIGEIMVNQKIITDENLMNLIIEQYLIKNFGVFLIR